MVCFNRFVGCLLASLFGLVFSSSVSAATISTTQPASNVACLDSAEQALLNGATHARCHFKSLTPRLTPDPATYGAYFCIQRRGSGTSYTVRQCNTSTSGLLSSFSGATAAAQSQTYYDNWDAPSFTTVAQASTAGNFYAFLWTTNIDSCSSTVDIDYAPFMAPTPNGSGNVCYQGCAYQVAIGYEGTWPSGQLVFYASALKRACTPEDPDSTEPNFDSDSPPIDIPGETPDTGPDPSDGTSGNSSSGGGTCASAPVCTGDSIQCNILYQTWATRCSNRDGGSEGGEPGQGNNADVVNEIKGLRDDLDEAFSDNFSDPNAEAGLSGLVYEDEINSGMIDSSGWGFPRTCPLWSDITFSVGVSSVTIPLSSFTGHCELFELTGLLILAFASFWSARYLLRS